ncbi:hypothetical protein [Amycolatopsis sp. NPDC051903]|uniref:hypothetical protein n=1 Tax=Amycolatopsis sp. NPDC051903 TaxID=3363936 RepID=UPI0037A2541F
MYSNTLRLKGFACWPFRLQAVWRVGGSSSARVRVVAVRLHAVRRGSAGRQGSRADGSAAVPAATGTAASAGVVSSGGQLADLPTRLQTKGSARELSSSLTRPHRTAGARDLALAALADPPTLAEPSVRKPAAVTQPAGRDPADQYANLRRGRNRLGVTPPISTQTCGADATGWA